MARKYVLFACATALPLASASLAVLLKLGSKDALPIVVFFALLGIVVLSGIIQWFSLIKPFRDIESTVLWMFDAAGKAGMELGNRDGIRPRLNVLLMYRPWKRVLMGHWLRICWNLGMEGQPDVGIRFPLSKGVAGVVCTLRQPKLVDTEETGHERWGFTPNEIRDYKLGQLTAIYSWPIYSVDKHNRQTGTVIGAVNLDARVQGACGIIKAHEGEYTAFLVGFSELVSRFVS